MKKTGLALLSAMVLLSAGLCFSEIMIQLPLVAMRDGKKVCDIYYHPSSLKKQEDGLIQVVTMMDLTPWGVECGMKDVPEFPAITKMVTSIHLVNLETGQIKALKSLYCDVDGLPIRKVDIRTDWFTPTPGEVAEVPLIIAREWAGQNERNKKEKTIPGLRTKVDNT